MKYVIRFLVAFLLIAVIGILSGFIAWWYTSDKLNSNEVEVPNVETMPLAKAREQLAAVQLDVVVINVHHENVPDGIVVSQEPPAGERTKTGRKIRLRVSQGILEFVMPDFTGKSFVEVKNLIRKMEEEQRVSNILVVNSVVYVNEDNIPSGYVVAQSPEPLSQIAKGVPVSLVISRGPKTLEMVMPELTGLSEAEAREMLQSVSVRIQVVAKQVSAGEPGRIFDQRPGFGQPLKPGSVVTLFVVSDVVTGERKSSMVPFVVPDDGRDHQVRIFLEDQDGRSEIDNRTLRSGQKEDIPIQYNSPARLIIYLDGKWHHEEEL